MQAHLGEDFAGVKAKVANDPVSFYEPGKIRGAGGAEDRQEEE